ncbi:hydantoinase B/oxoprolinase family protein [Achromobacter aloeverae]|uniref:Hydantoinase n=1 Tax=Achromobacter aloeverae TaxID=1750518 RepID=A0A4Q1HM30_9BURK|nr:hydantoinase B/oxoprolinase family protein [Achromobacter aloeverae]RXN91326.1 hydantoinase [Achromobacter aloeverae]
MNPTLDPITLELLWTRMISIVDEAAAAMVRTSFSTIVRESNDFACVLTTADGRSVAQATNSIPSFMNTMPRTIRHFLEAFPLDQLEPGDVLITNDIWQGTGHLPDISVAKPIFQGGKVVAWAGSVAHAPDIGGRIRSADAREVYEEGLQIPIMKVMRKGEIDATFERIIRKNVREPDQVMGDLFAQFTALRMIESRMLALMAERGLTEIDTLAGEIHARSEKAMRAAIRGLPEGVYRRSAISDGLDHPIKLALTLTIKDGEITVDYAGTDAQVPRSINVCLAYTIAYTCYGLRAVLLPNVPNNEGVMAPIHVKAPEGCILNSQPPAAGGARALIGHFVPMMVIGALADAMPERAIAAVGSPLWCVNLSGVRESGTPFTNLFFMNGGYGGSHKQDGANVLSWPSNISSTPVEMIEKMSPLHVRHRQLRTGTGGAGMHRGGTGQAIAFENRNKTPIVVSFMAERTRDEAAAQGLAGGQPGAPGAVILNGVTVNPKVQHVLNPGEVVELLTPGGGGFGPAGQRDPAATLRDAQDGYVGAAANQ